MTKFYFEINIDGEITSWAKSRGSENEIELDLEDNHPIFYENPFFFKFKDGLLTKDEAILTRIRANRQKNNEIRELKQVLAETDFYFIRQLDDRTPVPADVQVKRQQARKRLKELGL